MMVGKLTRDMVVILATCCRDMRTEQNITNSTQTALERHSDGMIAPYERNETRWLFTLRMSSK